MDCVCCHGHWNSVSQATADAAEYKAGFDKAAMDAAEYKAGFDKALYDNEGQQARLDKVRWHNGIHSLGVFSGVLVSSSLLLGRLPNR